MNLAAIVLETLFRSLSFDFGGLGKASSDCWCFHSHAANTFPFVSGNRKAAIAIVA